MMYNLRRQPESYDTGYQGSTPTLLCNQKYTSKTDREILILNNPENVCLLNLFY